MPPLQLHDNHRNTLLAGFKYIDRLLADGLVAVASAADDGAVFSPVVPDATPVQRKVIADQIGRLRRAIRAALEAFAIPVQPPSVSALWSLRTHLNFIEIALEDLGPKHLRGYGAIDEDTAAGVAVALAQIRAVLAELDGYLGADLGGDLSARLARLDQTRDEVRLLRELERIVTAHGLVDFRQPLALLLARLEKNSWTVAFVGRVSCGKSSLLNFLLAADLLPAGVTPVTAVPVRIVGGPAAAATVAFATGKPERIAATQLGEFASEEKNPGNVRHVTDILLELPAPRLAGDVCFVDTPGLGSLATSGAAQTLAFLPRCDVGVLMVDAAATPGEEDLAVARALLEGGAEVLVVVSKADLLTPPDREKMRAYVARQFATALGRDVPVALVSIAAGHTTLAENWWTETLAPRQARHREFAALTLRRRIGALREAVVAVLARGTGPHAARADAHAQLGAARAAIEEARRRAYDLPFETTPPANEVLAGAAAALARLDGGADLGAAFAHELGKSAALLSEKFDTLLRDTLVGVGPALVAGPRPADERQPYRSALGPTRSTLEFPPPSGRPLFDPAPVVTASRLSDSWRRWPAEAARRAALWRQLRSRFSSALDDALRHYGHALVGWSHHYLDDLAAQFNAQAGLVEAAAAPTAAAPSPELARDLALLREWNSRPAA